MHIDRPSLYFKLVDFVYKLIPQFVGVYFVTYYNDFIFSIPDWYIHFASLVHTLATTAVGGVIR